MISTLASELIESVRLGLDEFNVDSVDEAQILKALNRARRVATNIVARKYEDAFLDYTMYTASAAEQEIDIPEACFAGRIERIEYMVGNRPVPMARISFRKGATYESRQSSGAGAIAWCQVGEKIRVFNSLTAGQQLRIWYTRSPEVIVKEQGRVTGINVANNYIEVDAVGSDLTSESDDLNNYVNIVDAQTGRVKVTLQITTVVGTRITFKSTPDRSTVLNKTISSAIPTTVDNMGVRVAEHSRTARGPPSHLLVIRCKSDA